MKKTFLNLALLVIAAVILSGCSDNNASAPIQKESVQQKSINEDIAIQSQEEKNNQAKLDAALKSLDTSIKPGVLIVADDLNTYVGKNKSFKGFIADKTFASTPKNNYGCKSEVVVDISPDGKKYVVYRPLCSNDTVSFCFENGYTDVVESDTSFIEKNYKCK